MLAGQALTIATCWKIVRPDGQVFTFTDHDRDLIVGGETYDAGSGFTRSADASDSSMSSPNVEIVGFVDALHADELRNGLWDYSAVSLFLVNWASPDDGEIKMRRGTLGEFTMDDTGEFKVELRGISELLSSKIGELYSTECRAQLGDSRCKVDLTPFTVTGTVLSGSTQHVIVAAVGQPAGWWDQGVVEMTSGPNTGTLREVLSWDGSNHLTLFLPMPHPVSPGETFKVQPGCDRQLRTCKNKFNNVLNFRGEPFLPGMDALLDYKIPGSSTSAG
jgi:uncharacterized phage protein (TIGR02218 family)